jgi:hypothetical protein
MAAATQAMIPPELLQIRGARGEIVKRVLREVVPKHDDPANPENGGNAQIIERAWADSQRRRTQADSAKIVGWGIAVVLGLTAVWGLL